MGFWCSLLAEVLGGVATAVFLAGLAAGWAARYRVAANDREVADLDEDGGRFLRDRDRVLRTELRGTSVQMAAEGQLYSGAIVRALAECKREALHDYRDEFTRKRRRFEEICDAERRSLTVRLARRRRPLPAFVLSAESRRILASWREDARGPGTDDTGAIDDPTSEAREPDLRRFERDGDSCAPTQRSS